MKLAEVADKVAAVFSTRGAKVIEYTTTLARHAAAGAEDEKAIAAQQAKVDAHEFTRLGRELERLKAKAADNRRREERERAEVEGDLRAIPAREKERFKARVDRLFERVRNPKPGDRPQAETEVNTVSGAQRVTNLPALQKWLDLGSLLSRLTGEIHHEMWKLDDLALHARLTELRKELDSALEGTALESESEA